MSAFQIWKHVSPFERAEKLTYFAELIEKNREDLAVLITAEMGKPYREALTEVDYALSFVTWYAEKPNVQVAIFLILHGRDHAF